MKKTFNMVAYQENDLLSHNIINYGYWSAEYSSRMVQILNYLKDNLGNEIYFFDVGANIGWFSLVVAAQNIPVISNGILLGIKIPVNNVGS
jgi:hypothetical protein